MGRLVNRVGRLVPGEVIDARAQATALVNAAHAHADRLVTEARAAAEAVREAARESGRAAGEAEAEAAFTSLLLAARADAERVRAAAIPSARALAVRMAEKIIGHALRLDPATLAEIVAQAVSATRVRTGLVTLRVHPDDLSAIEMARPHLMARMGSAVDLRVVPDETVGRSGCIVETPVGRLDARLATQLTVLERALYGDDVARAGGGDGAGSRAAARRG